MYYRQLRQGVEDSNSKFIPASDNIDKHVKLGDQFKDYYLSIYKFNDDQYNQFKTTKSIKQITDVVTDKLVFDFDSKDLEQAKLDTIEICSRLAESGIDLNDLKIAFSGNKGFHVEVDIDENITPSEHKAIAKQLANGLTTFDPKVYDAARPFRVPGSINKKSGLFKMPLTPEELLSFTTEEVMEKAKYFKNYNSETSSNNVIKLPETLSALRKFKEEYKPKVTVMETELDWTKKPKFLSNCRYALNQGFFEAGSRDNALLCLAATYRNLNFDKDDTYRLLKSAADKQAKRTGTDRFSDDEIWGNILSQVYKHDWKGGQFTCRDPHDPFLYNYCQSLGSHKCSHKDDDCFIEIDDFASKFSNFAENITKNTLKLGIPVVDDKVMITTSMLVGLLGAPSAGKTNLLLNFLEQSNKDQIDSVFFSMDMGLPLVYLRLVQRHFGYTREKVFKLFQESPEEVIKIVKTIEESYKYTKFSFKTGLSVENIKNAVLDHQEKTGRKVKLIGIDYLECISGPYSDATANTGLIANQLKDIANDLDTCVMLLLQTQKQSGDPSDPLLSMRNVKGSSVIEQACSVILSLSRPGFSPTIPEDDRFATISTVKDRMSSLISLDCGWDGLRGYFSNLENPEDIRLLKEVRTRKAAAANSKEKEWFNS